jgi:hypothetical protein
MALRTIPASQKWIGQIFSAKQAKRGGIVRRKVTSVKKYATVKDLKAEVKRRGFHMLRSGDQYLIFCHKGAFRVIC